MSRMIFLLSIMLVVLPLSACDPAQPTDTVESLAANPERLKTLREQCRLERSKVGESLCNRVAQATRKRFYGYSGTPEAEEK